jgi:hypothetical protein
MSTDFDSESVFGAGGLTISVALNGTDLELTTTGIASTQILWAIYWRVLHFTDTV